MTLQPGTHLGPYEITASIGTGGMGEVYKARDTRLDRMVAIKVLPEHLASHPDALARFEREAKAVAALNHPNILGLFDIGHEGSTTYVVMELLEGESLRSRLEQGALPPRKAIELSVQLAQGLAAVHEKGIIHRDLKPENLWVSKDGRLKILDFGLARQVPGMAGRAEKSTEIIGTAHQTASGMILGTVGYMSPEQVRGEIVDHRSDIFSFGTALYEMLTGRQAFARETTAESMTAILKEDPPEIRASDSGASTALARIVQHCLEKKPEERFQSARDIVFALQSLSGSAVTSGPSAVVTRRGSRPGLTVIALAAACVLAGIFATLYFQSARKHQADNNRVMRLQFVPTKGERLSSLDSSDSNARSFAISPDGTKLVYVAAKGASTEIWIRSLGVAESAAIPGTEGGQYPFFSPDGKWIAFNARHKLAKITMSGGKPVTLGDAPAFRGGVWGDNGWIYFVPNAYVPISRIPDTGGPIQNVTKIRSADGEQQHRWPELLPDGNTILYAVGSGSEWDEATIVAERLDTGERKVLVKGGTSPRYLPTGHLIYARAGALYALAFNTRSLVTEGSPVEVARNIGIGAAGAAQMDFSRTGMLVTAPSDAGAGNLMLSWVDRTGMGEPLNMAHDQYLLATISPDGRKVALTIINSIGVLDLDRLVVSKLTLSARSNNQAWSGDGRRLFFGLEKGRHFQVFSKAADDSGSEQIAFASDVSESPLQVSFDGSRLLTWRALPDGQLELVVHELNRAAPGREGKVLFRSLYFGLLATFSPDARFVVYESQESGRPEIYVRPASGEDRKWQVSTEGGTYPVWSPDGKEIFYLRGREFLAAPVDTGSGDFHVGTPKVLFENHEISFFDITRDGKRFFVAENPNPGASTHLDIVTNWFSEVGKKVLEARSP